MSAKVIAITNQKGGVAKTTTATAMAVSLTKRGYKTLLVDADQQMNASDTYRAKIDDTPTLFDVMMRNEPVASTIQHLSSGDILPGDSLLSTAEQQLAGATRDVKMKEILKAVKEDYDYIIIDTPPGFGIMLLNALIAADACIIPITASRYAFTGLQELDKTIREVNTLKSMFGGNDSKPLKIDGLLLCRFKPNQQLSKQVLQDIDGVAEALGTKAFKTTIRECVAIEKAQSECMSIYEKDPDCTTAQDYEMFLDEYLEGEKQNG